ncbi:MAG: class I SAM-dependent methyltransferase [Streptococcaceae bacterium]|jgi:ubiquinone/menaquinone biosynthesis C-methylase UbiE|nr:class I SAM-dependent methyltransferase [Streptococcaceae bacterium]
MSNLELFNGKAIYYKEARPDYPQGLLRDLEKLGKKVVLDIGAGSGVLARQLLQNKIGEQVIASEPNEEMRLLLDTSIGGFENARVLYSPSESIQLANASVDLIIAAQAFHYFDIELFHREAVRVLRKDGWVSLIWTSRTGNTAFESKLSEIEEKNGRISEKIEIQVIQDFFNSSFLRKQYRSNVKYDKDSFVKRHLSSSYAPSVETDKGKSMVKDLETLFDEFQEEGILEIPLLTYHYYGQLK